MYKLIWYLRVKILILSKRTRIVVDKFLPSKVIEHMRLVIIGPKIFVRRLFVDSIIREWRHARKNYSYIKTLKSLARGVNIIGYFQAAKGIGEAARSSHLAIKSVDFPHTIIDFEEGISEELKTEKLLTNENNNKFRFNTNLIHLNPPQLPYLWNHFGYSGLAERYTIGVWYWELPKLPVSWKFAFSLVDELWVATQFIYDAVRECSSVPVFKMPPCVNVNYDHNLTRSDFGLPSNKFLFLCAFDMLSIASRKNPIGSIKAFKRAFHMNNQEVALIIKLNNADYNLNELRKIETAMEGYNNIYILNQTLDKLQMNSLLNLVDAYVSLHRSEGFGLVPAEAMSLGKPTLLTRWSGTLDYMTDQNCCGVDYKLISAKEYTEDNSTDQVWADPDLDHAAYYMKKLVREKDYYNYISQNAMHYISTNFSPSVIGEKMRSRLIQISGS